MYFHIATQMILCHENEKNVQNIRKPYNEIEKVDEVFSNFSFKNGSLSLRRYIN